MADTVDRGDLRPVRDRTRGAPSTLSRQAWSTSCSKAPGRPQPGRWGTRARASTVPSASAATALTDVVPMSMPTVTPPPGMLTRTVRLRVAWRGSD